MRLVCRRFASAATFVFADLTSREEFDEYTVLNFPPSSMTLERLRAVLMSKAETLLDPIQKLVYHVTTAVNADLDTDYLSDWFISCDWVDCDGCPCGSGCHERNMADKNVALFLQQCADQDTFANRVSSPFGTTQLGAILSRLKSLDEIHINVEDYWEHLFGWDTATAETSAVGINIYRNVFPVLLEQLSRSRASSLVFSGWGSHAWAGLPPSKLVELSRKRNFLNNITSFELIANHRDDTNMLDGLDEPYYTELRRGDRASLLLGCMKNLASLTLSVSDDKDHSSSEAFRDREWLYDVLGTQAWKGLRSFSLKNFRANEEALAQFFKNHTRCLREVCLDNLDIPNRDLIVVLKLMRAELQLKESEIIVLMSKVHDQELKTIAAQRGVEVPDRGAFKDLGLYTIVDRPGPIVLVSDSDEFSD